MFLELPPPTSKSPNAGLRAIVLKLLFLVDVLAVFLSSYKRPPAMSLEHSRKPFMFPVSASQIITCPPRVVVTSSSLLVGWKSQATTSLECCRVSRIPCLPKMSQILTV